MTRASVTLLLCGSIVGCGQDIEYPPPETPIEILRDEEVLSTDVITTTAYWIEADPSTGRLVTLDYHADSPVVVFDTSGTVMARLGRRGEGPGELKDTRSLTVSDGIGYVWDLSQGRYGRFDVASPTKLETVSLGTELPVVLEVEPLSSGTLLLTGNMGTSLAVSLQAGTETLEFIGHAPATVLRLAGDDESLQMYLSKSSSAVNETADMVALGYYHTGEIVFARLSTGETVVETRPGNWADVSFSRKYERRGLRKTTDKSFLGYRTVKATEDGVWAFCICNTRDLSNKSFPYARRDVHYYSWSGELVRIYRLSRSVEDIAVLGQYLYATVNDPVPAVVRWKLPAS